MIRDLNNRLYIGVSNNPKQRLHDHNHKAGAKFTSSVNFKIILLEEYITFKEARLREIQIKKWRRDKKEMLIERYMNKMSTK
jgi:predicted GIY-YIG superfamily endonuclease